MHPVTAPAETASARLTKTTVSHSQAVISQPERMGWAGASPVVSAAPTSVTNMTGFRTSVTGLSSRRASGRARLTPTTEL